MAKHIFFLLLLSANLVNAQSKEVKTLLQAIDTSAYSINDNHIIYTQEFDLPGESKVNIALKISQYLNSQYFGKYGTVKEMDLHNGIITTEGLYLNAYETPTISEYLRISTQHIFQFKALDGKLKMSVTLVNYKITGDETFTIAIVDTYPFNQSEKKQNVFGKAFYNSNLLTHTFINEVDTYMNKSATSGLD